MEGGRPPVQFVGGCDVDAEDGTTAEGGASSSDEFRALRQQHYDEVAAVTRFRTESGEEDGDNASTSSSEHVLDESPAITDTGTQPNSTYSTHAVFLTPG